MHIQKFDIAVVGGGPAGSSAALSAARQGRSVVLFEQFSMPRVKPCGGAVSEQALGYLGFQIPKDLIDWECYGARVNFRGSVNIVRKPDRIAILVSRERFDTYLINKAIASGVVVVYKKVTKLTSDGDLVKIFVNNECVECKGAIIAQGATGNLIRSVRPADRRDQIGVCAEMRLPVTSPDRFADLDKLIDIYFGVNRFGYGWVFHHGRYYSVGIGGLSSLLASPRKTFHEFCKHIGFDSTDCQPKIHAIPCGGVTRRIVKDRIMLVGDSAGFVDPFYGEGIAYAIRSGQIAAETLCSAIEGGNMSASYLGTYTHRCEAEFGGNLRSSLRLTRLMHRYPDAFLRLLSVEQSVLEKYLDVPMNRLGYSSYLAWLLTRAPWYIAKSLWRSVLS